VTVAFWPAFRSSSGSPRPSTSSRQGSSRRSASRTSGRPPGFARQPVRDLIPLLLAAAAIVLVNGQTAGDEAGPVASSSTSPSRSTGAPSSWVGPSPRSSRSRVITVVLAAVQIGADALFDLSIAWTACSPRSPCAPCSALLHGSLAVAIAGLRARPTFVSVPGWGIAVAGYVVAALFSLSSELAPLRHLSPWDWAFGGNPLEQATDAWRYAALAVRPSPWSRSVFLPSRGVTSRRLDRTVPEQPADTASGHRPFHAVRLSLHPRPPALPPRRQPSAERSPRSCPAPGG